MDFKVLASCGVIILIIVLFIIMSSKSFFIADILNTNYGTVGCSKEDRVYPSGKVPGSYLGLSRIERDNLLKAYIDNNTYLNN